MSNKQKELEPLLQENHHEFVVDIADDIREGILDAAKHHAADILVIGSRGLSGVSRLILGSVSHYCVTNADIPVLVVPPCAQN